MNNQTTPLKRFWQCLPIGRQWMLTLLLGIVYLTNTFAEGTKQLAPNSSDIVMLMTNRADFGNFASYGAPSANRLYFSIKEANEMVYLGLSREYSASGTPQFFGTYQYRIVRAADSTVVHGPFEVSLMTENVSSWEDAVRGPYEITGEGYQAIDNQYQFEATEVGDYYIEFTDVQYIGYWDITVAKDGNKIDGRVWSKNWAFRTPVQSNNLPSCLWDREFNGALYSYTADGFVTRIDFEDSGFQGLSFNVAFNETGPGDTGDLALDRMSVANVNTTGNLAKHKIFLNEPDMDLFPSGNCGGIVSASTFQCDDNGGFCLPAETSQAGLVEVVLDFNQNGIFDPNSADVTLVHNFSEDNLMACIPWNGLKGDSSAIDFSEEVNLVFKYAQGIQHWSVYDGEVLKNGFCVEAVRPICGDNVETNVLYWDDRNIQENPGTNQSKDGRGGCNCEDDDCRTWDYFDINVPDCSEVEDSLTIGYGDKNTINTWWFANVVFFEEVNVPLLSLVIEGDSEICVGETTTLTLQMTSAEMIETIEWFQNGNLISSGDETNTSLTIDEIGNYQATITTLTGCQESNSLEVTSEICPIDLELDKTVSNLNPYRGDLVAFSLYIVNNGPGMATGIALTDYIEDGFTSIQNISNGGNFNGTSIIWENLSLDPTESITLSFEARVDFSGTYQNTAEITAANEDDIDSTPNNGIGLGEDDEDSVVLAPLDCEVSLEVSNIICLDNGTPSNPSDDQFTFDLLVDGSGLSDFWMFSGTISGAGQYGVTTTVGPHPISLGTLSLDLHDILLPDCGTAFEVIPPQTCSDECALDASILSTLCDDNGTPADASDDLFTVEVLVASLNSTGNTWNSNLGISGTYDEVMIIGPFAIEDGNFTLNIYDSGDASCGQSLDIAPPATCSDLCLINTAIQNIACSDNGTPSDASDDVFTFELLVDGFNLGNSWTSSTGAYSGNYNDLTSFGPFPISAGSLSITIVDDNDSSCANTFTVEPPATCSNQCAIDAIVQTVSCLDNGTPSDASDDLFVVEVFVEGFNLGSNWVSTDGMFSGNYNENVSLGPFSIANGTISFDLQDANDANCSTTISVDPPATCSDQCEMNIAVQNVFCSDNNTPSDASDDLFSFDLFVSGSNLGANWVSIDGSTSGAYGELITIGPFPITDGAVSFTLEDSADADCTESFVVDPPTTCSDQCEMNVQVLNIICSDNETPSDASDDLFIFELKVEGYNLSSNWNSNDGTLNGLYDETIVVGPFPIADGTLEFTLVDANDSSCTSSFVVEPPATCSERCEINALVQNILCSDNGTPSDASDDLFTFELVVDGLNLGTAWQTSDGNFTGAYQTAIEMGPFPIGEGIQSFSIRDIDDINCTTSVTVEPPAPCSDECIIQLIELRTSCNANDTYFDSSDDFFYADVTLTATNGSTKWAISGQEVGNYGEAVTLGPFNDFEALTSILVHDLEDASCTFNLNITPPQPCFIECDIDVDLIAVYCDDMGTPENGTDDQFFCEIRVNSLPISSSWVADNGQTGVTDEIVALGPFDVINGNVSVDLFDEQAFGECFETIFAEAPSLAIECPEDTSSIHIQKDMQLLLGNLDKSDEVYPEVDTFCWVNYEVPEGIHYFDTIQLRTGPNVVEKEIFTFILYADFPIIDTPSLPLDAMDGLGAIFWNQYDASNPCCNILTGSQVPFAPETALNWHPEWNVEVPELDSLEAVLQLSVRLDPNETYTLLTSSWGTGGEGPYAWLVFSNQSDEQLQFIENEIDTDVQSIQGDLIYDYFTGDTEYIFDSSISFQWTGEASVADSCGLSDIIFNDSLVTALCEDNIIYREFIAQDFNGLADTCVQEIHFRTPTLLDVNFPNWRVIYECGDDFMGDENGHPHPMETGYPYIYSYFDVFDLDSTYYNLTATYQDSTNVFCGSASEIYRTWTIVDYCMLEDTLQFVQLIKLGMEEPIVECPLSNHYCPILEENIMLFSVDPFETTATIEIPQPSVTGSCISDWESQIEIFAMINGNLELVQTILPGEPRIAYNLAIGDYTIRYTIMDECNTYGVLDCIIRIADLQEPIAICHGGLNFSIGNFGVRRIYLQQIDNFSYDNTEIQSIAIRRKYMADAMSCEPLSVVEFSDWGPYVEVTCCDVGNYVTVELQVIDIYGNENICWTDVLIEDKTAPTCIGIDDVTIDCADIPLDFDPFNTNQLADLFGTVTVYDNCEAGIVAVDPVVNLDDCGSGTIIREFYAQDNYGNVSSNVVTQVVTIGGESGYAIQFPADTLLYCNDLSLADTTHIYRQGCDLLAWSYEDVYLTDDTTSCFYVERTYSIINWCTYDGIADPVIIRRDEDCDGLEGEESVWLLHTPLQNYIDRDSFAFNAWPMAEEKDLSCDGTTNPEGFWRTTISTGYWQYTQLIYVQDTLAPLVEYQTLQDRICTDDQSCEATISLDVYIQSLCDFDTLIELSALWDEGADGILDHDLAITGTYPNFTIVNSYPIGVHRIEITAVDSCGNTTLETIDFEVVPCHGVVEGCTNAPSNYEVKFPKDVAFECELGEVVDTVELYSLACDLLAVSYTDEVMDASDSLICTAIKRTYQVINWCEFDGSSDPTIISRNEDCDAEIGEENIWLLRRPNIAYLDRDSSELNSVPQAEEKGLSCDATTNPEGYWQTLSSNGYWQYEQHIIVYSNSLPEIAFTTLNEPLFLDPESCDAAIDIPFLITGGCFDDNEVEITIWLDELQNGSMDVELREAGFVTGVFPSFSIETTLGSGNHTLYFELTDNCGNTVLDQLQIEVIDNYIELPQCADTIVVDLVAVEPIADVNGDGEFDAAMAMIEAATLIAENASDCSGELSYSLNWPGAVANANSSSLLVTCDADASFELEVYAWDNAFNPYAIQPDGTIGGANYDWCTTTIVLRDLDNTCTGDTETSTEGETPIDNGGFGLTSEDDDQYHLKSGASSSKDAYELYQNRPNPFTNQTIIAFQMAEEEEAEIIFTDISGKIVKRIQQSFDKGYNEITVSANELGGSGVYHYAIRTKHFYAYRKLVITL